MNDTGKVFLLVSSKMRIQPSTIIRCVLIGPLHSARHVIVWLRRDRRMALFHFGLEYIVKRLFGVRRAFGKAPAPMFEFFEGLEEL